jgi:serine/threonine protein kinase
LLPQRIGKYEVVGKLGQGAMGEVFHAHDPVLNRDVAVKRITAGLDAGSSSWRWSCSTASTRSTRSPRDG